MSIENNVFSVDFKFLLFLLLLLLCTICHPKTTCYDRTSAYQRERETVKKREWFFVHLNTNFSAKNDTKIKKENIIATKIQRKNEKKKNRHHQASTTQVQHRKAFQYTIYKQTYNSIKLLFIAMKNKRYDKKYSLTMRLLRQHKFSCERTFDLNTSHSIFRGEVCAYHPIIIFFIFYFSISCVYFWFSL